MQARLWTMPLTGRACTRGRRVQSMLVCGGGESCMARMASIAMQTGLSGLASFMAAGVRAWPEGFFPDMSNNKLLVDDGRGEGVWCVRVCVCGDVLVVVVVIGKVEKI